MKENKFDELAKGLAQPTTRRQALRKFGVGLAGMALACFGLANTAKAHRGDTVCGKQGAPCAGLYPPCCKGLVCTPVYTHQQTVYVCEKA